MNAPAIHAQPPAIQVFCEGLTDRTLQFLRQNSDFLKVIGYIALTILATAGFAALPILFTGSVVASFIGGIGWIVSFCIGFASVDELPFHPQNPYFCLVTIIAFTVLGIAVFAALPWLLPAITGLELAMEGLKLVAICEIFTTSMLGVLVYTKLRDGHLL